MRTSFHMKYLLTLHKLEMYLQMAKYIFSSIKKIYICNLGKDSEHFLSTSCQSDTLQLLSDIDLIFKTWVNACRDSHLSLKYHYEPIVLREIFLEHMGFLPESDVFFWSLWAASVKKLI